MVGLDLHDGIRGTGRNTKARRVLKLFTNGFLQARLVYFMQFEIGKLDSNAKARSRELSVPIITYHSIDKSGSVISTAPYVFRRQMKHLSELGYQAIPLRELAASLNSKTAFPAKTVVLTFDDGFKNFYLEAFPILSEYNFSGTVFLVTDFCGKYNDWPGNPTSFPRSELLSWEEIKELDSYGIEFGSHTRTHQDLTRLTVEKVESEMVESKTAIANILGRETITFAYPFGRSNAAARQIAKRNFKASCSTNLGKVSSESDSSSLNRIDAYYFANQRLFEKFPTAAFDNYLRFRQTIRDVKSLLAWG